MPVTSSDARKAQQHGLNNIILSTHIQYAFRATVKISRIVRILTTILLLSIQTVDDSGIFGREGGFALCKVKQMEKKSRSVQTKNEKVVLRSGD